jgi:hypothetical protein
MLERQMLGVRPLRHGPDLQLLPAAAHALGFRFGICFHQLASQTGRMSNTLQLLLARLLYRNDDKFLNVSTCALMPTNSNCLLTDPL